MGLQFEWDEGKERINIAKHGIDFATARNMVSTLQRRVMCFWILTAWNIMMKNTAQRMKIVL